MASSLGSKSANRDMMRCGKIIAFIADPRPEEFDALTLEVFHYQFEHVRLYREYCISLKRDLRRINSANEIPALSTAAFKYAELTTDVSSSDRKIFLTSGTSVGRDRRGRHFVPWPEVYRASAMTHMRRMLFADSMATRVLSLHPTADRMPESSLSQMISWCIDEFGHEPYMCVATREGIDTDAALEFLSRAEVDAALVCILGTTASLGRLFEVLASRPIRLAPGSRVMDTGGAKGQTSPLNASTLFEMAERLLGVPPAMVINEYGMTELCSQMYDATPFNDSAAGPSAERVKIAPPWLRVSAVDPITMRPVARGEIGLLRFFDFANIGSVSAILTEDLGMANGDRVRILGRAGQAEPRGCALAIRQFEASEHDRTVTG